MAQITKISPAASAGGWSATNSNRLSTHFNLALHLAGVSSLVSIFSLQSSIASVTNLLSSDSWMTAYVLSLPIRL